MGQQQKQDESGPYVESWEIKDIYCPQKFRTLKGNRPLSEGARKLAVHRNLLPQIQAAA